MKKIGIICNLMTSYGGVQTCVISLIKGLNSNGIVPYLLSDTIPNPKLWEEHGLDCNVEKINFSISSSFFYKHSKILFPIWEFIFFYKTSWLKEHYDFIYIFQPNVIVNNNQKHLFYLSMSPRAKKFSKNSFTTKIKNSFYNIFLKKIHPIFEFQKYHCVINSNYTSGMFEEYYGKKIDVVYPSNAIELNLPKKIVKKSNTVMFLSRLSPAKKVEKVLELAKIYPDFFFYILGGVDPKNEGYLEKIKANIAKYDLKNIKIIVNPKYSELKEYLYKAEYYIFFAKNEHFGITTVEAMLYGCIPFVHNSGGQKEIVPKTNLRFEYLNMKDKFEALIKLDGNEKELLKHELKEHVLKFKEDVFIDKMLAYHKH